MPCGTWVNARDRQWNLLGRIAEGRIELGDSVVLPTTYGSEFRGYVARFAESFTEWLGLPFYVYLTAETMPEPFCRLRRKRTGRVPNPLPWRRAVGRLTSRCSGPRTAAALSATIKVFSAVRVR